MVISLSDIITPDKCLRASSPFHLFSLQGLFSSETGSIISPLSAYNFSSFSPSFLLKISFSLTPLSPSHTPAPHPLAALSSSAATSLPSNPISRNGTMVSTNTPCPTPSTHLCFTFLRLFLASKEVPRFRQRVQLLKPSPPLFGTSNSSPVLAFDSISSSSQKKFPSCLSLFKSSMSLLYKTTPTALSTASASRAQPTMATATLLTQVSSSRTPAPTSLLSGSASSPSSLFLDRFKFCVRTIPPVLLRHISTDAFIISPSTISIATLVETPNYLPVRSSILHNCRSSSALTLL